jgi:hypothetical protein
MERLSHEAPERGRNCPPVLGVVLRGLHGAMHPAERSEYLLPKAAWLPE